MRSPWSPELRSPDLRSPDLRSPDVRSPDSRERGSITAEFAAVMPAVLIVLLVCLAGLQVAGLQLRLQDASADVARSLSRGDPRASIAAQLEHAVPGANLTVVHRGDAVCADLAVSAPAGVAALAGLTVRASGCALSGGL
jgi:hypothetical protein